MGFIRCDGAAGRRPGAWGIRGLAAGCALSAAVGAAWWAAGVGGEQVLHAQGDPSLDSDGDGLLDRLEVVIGTSAAAADSDGDSFSDAEELARHSDALDAACIPSGAGSSIGMDAFQDELGVHAVTVVYLHDGRTRGKVINFGGRIGTSMAPVSQQALRGGASARVLPARNGEAKLLVLDPLFDPQTVILGRGFSLFATLSAAGSYLAADACNLAVIGFDIFELVPAPGVSLPSGPAQTGSTGGGIGIGGVYRPIGPGDGSPNYVQGEICAQTTVIVGVIGAVVTQEVVAADCVPGWDAHCTPGCEATVGTTLKAVDPAALIGG
jgi:hypothetical protein